MSANLPCGRPRELSTLPLTLTAPAAEKRGMTARMQTAVVYLVGLVLNLGLALGLGSLLH
jgi:hypothetical protein